MRQTLDTHDINHFNKSIYSTLDIDATLDYMLRRFVQPLTLHFDIRSSSLIDCASGYGWLSFSYLIAGGKHAVLIEPDRDRLDAARLFAERLGLEKRCDFSCSCLQDVDIPPADIVASIETLEHVGRPNIARCIHTMLRLAKRGVLITTPNGWFPIIAHDTQLLIAHWLPKSWRPRYARLFGKDTGEHNDFLNPIDLWPLYKDGFRPLTRYHTFTTYGQFRRLYPYYLPYGSHNDARFRERPGMALASFVSTVGTVAGRCSFIMSPNLISIWSRENVEN